MTPEAFNGYAHVCIGMLICAILFLVITLIELFTSAQADRRKRKLLAQKYRKGNDGGNNA